MKNGRILFMLDGLDEAEPELRDHYVAPWFIKVCQQYPKCRYLVSSRPVGYPPGMLRSSEFVECDLLDFGTDEIREYTRHWCTAVRLARNKPEEEARREGVIEFCISYASDFMVATATGNCGCTSAASPVSAVPGGCAPTGDGAEAGCPGAECWRVDL